jgi:hypothetical protein
MVEQLSPLNPHNRPVKPSPNRRSVVAPLEKNRVTDGARPASVQNCGGAYGD